MMYSGRRLTDVLGPEEHLLVTALREHLEDEVVIAAVGRAEVERLETEDLDEGSLELFKLCKNISVRETWKKESASKGWK
jgi:hypothetical protein